MLWKGSMQKNISHQPYHSDFLISLKVPFKTPGFPGGSVVKNPLANAGDTGFHPWSGMFPHACRAVKLGRDNNWACALKATSHNYWSPHPWEPMPHNNRSHSNEKPKYRNLRVPPLTKTREKPTQQQRSSTTLPKKHTYKSSGYHLLHNLYAEYITQNARLDESQIGIKTARRNINNNRYADDNTLIAESEEELKSLLRRVKEESGKSWLKTEH